MPKPILCLDFDGVIHSYTSGWKGASVIPDAPVPGALEFVVGALDKFQVEIFSSRSHQWGGKLAMKRWLHKQLVNLEYPSGAIPKWWEDRIMRTAFADPWPDEVHHAASIVIRDIKWPWFKPPALVTIDDRAIMFDGTWPSFDSIKAFKPWNKRN